MKKIVTSLLILILIPTLIGCSKTTTKYSSSSLNLKPEYTKTFSSTFVFEADKITKISIDLYNKAIIDTTPEAKTFESKYKEFDKVVPQNASEKDFKDAINKYALYYSMLALDTSILITEQDLRDRGIENKDKYDAKMEKYQKSKTENLKHIESDMKNIMKYYE